MVYSKITSSPQPHVQLVTTHILWIDLEFLLLKRSSFRKSVTFAWDFGEIFNPLLHVDEPGVHFMVCSDFICSPVKLSTQICICIERGKMFWQRDDDWVKHEYELFLSLFFIFAIVKVNQRLLKHVLLCRNKGEDCNMGLIHRLIWPLACSPNTVWGLIRKRNFSKFLYRATILWL